MSFAKIAEARAVKKIVAWLRQESKKAINKDDPEYFWDAAADRIELGEYRDIELPSKKSRRS